MDEDGFDADDELDDGESSDEDEELDKGEESDWKTSQRRQRSERLGFVGRLMTAYALGRHFSILSEI